MLLQNKTPEEANAPVEYVHPPITPYRDAADCPAHYTLSILDCLRGLRKGLDLGLLRLDQFDVKEYEHYERVVNGDFNWITPFFIAFAGPTDPMTRARLVENQAKAAEAAAEAAAQGREMPTEEEETTSEGSSSSTMSSLASTRSNTPSPIQSSAGSSRISTPFIPSTVTLLVDQPKDCSLSSSLQASSIHHHHEDSKVKAPSPLSSSITRSSAEGGTEESTSSSTSISEGKEEKEAFKEEPPVEKKVRRKLTRLQKNFQSLLDYFEQKAKVHTVIRLNASTYDKNHFLARGMQHMDMIFADGTNPPWSIVELFMDVCEEVIQFKHGVVAVHCMAGLGRTGTLIGAYLMRHFDMTAREVIAYLRLMRPGSVVGPQQNWLAENEWKLRGKQTKLEKRMFGKTVTRPSSPTSSLRPVLQTPATDYDAVFSRASSAGLEPPPNVIEGGSITLLDSDENASTASSSTISSTATSEDTDDSDYDHSASVIDSLDTIAAEVLSDSAKDSVAVTGDEAIPIQPRKHDDSHHHHHSQHHHHQ